MQRKLRRLWFDIREQWFLALNQSSEGRFQAIFRGNLWQNTESTSGFGSTLSATKSARNGLEGLISRFNVETLLDVPCGDFNWMQHLRYEGNYIGCDIVADLVQRNQAKFGTMRRRFEHLDLCNDKLPEADLVLCRECLNHLSLDECLRAVHNLSQAAKEVIVITHYPGTLENVDQSASFRYRPLNYMLPPFNLRQPDEMIDEGDFEPGKVLAVWHGSAPLIPGEA
jgi:hypothetical protein